MPKPYRDKKGGYQNQNWVDVTSELQAEILRRRKEDRRQAHADNRQIGIRMHRAQQEALPMEIETWGELGHDEL